MFGAPAARAHAGGQILGGHQDPAAAQGMDLATEARLADDRTVARSIAPVASSSYEALCAAQEMRSYFRRRSSPVKPMPCQRLPIGRGQRLAMYIIQKVVCIPRHRSAERQLPGTLACGPCQSHERTICASCRNAYAHALDPGP